MRSPGKLKPHLSETFPIYGFTDFPSVKYFCCSHSISLNCVQIILMSRDCQGLLCQGNRFGSGKFLAKLLTAFMYP